MSTSVVMLAPDGTSGELSPDKVPAAMQAGAKRAYLMYAPDGKSSGYVPEDRVSDAMKAGATQMSPQQKQINASPVTQAPASGGTGILGRLGDLIQNQATKHPDVRDTALGAASGAGLESMNPVSDMAKGMVSGAKPTGMSAIDPTGGALSMAFGAGKQELGSLKEAAGRTPGADRGTVEHGLAASITRPLTFLGGGEEAGDALSGAPSATREAMQEVTGIGASKDALLRDMHEHALATQAHVQGVSDAVHTEAQQAMSSVASKIDAAHPEGVFPKGDVRNVVKDAFGSIAKLPDQMPASLSDVVSDTSGKIKTNAALSGRQQSGAMMASQLLKKGVPLEDVKSAMTNLGYMPKEVDSIIAGTGDAAKPVSQGMTFEQLKQVRSNLGRELPRLNGAVGAAANKTYGALSDMLRGAAKEQGVEPDWLEANSKYKNWANDFQRSPVGDMLKGQNASEIMKPLTGPDAVVTKQILDKYQSHGINSQAVTQETKRATLGNTVSKWSNPSKMDLILAAFSPKAAAIRSGIPRIMRSPSSIDMLAGEGLKEMTPSKIALKAAQKAGK